MNHQSTSTRLRCTAPALVVGWHLLFPATWNRAIKTNADSGYSYRWIPTVAGNYELQVSWAARASEYSPVISKTVELDCLRTPISITNSTGSSSTMVGLRINVADRLVDQYGDALRKEVVVIHYTFSGISDWVPITSAETDIDSDYSITWIPTATDCYPLSQQGKTAHLSALALALSASTLAFTLASRSASCLQDTLTMFGV